jgi:hypothetical protein
MSYQSAPPDVIYIIRHGEKPEEPAPRRTHLAAALTKSRPGA